MNHHMPDDASHTILFVLLKTELHLASGSCAIFKGNIFGLFWRTRMVHWWRSLGIVSARPSSSYSAMSKLSGTGAWIIYWLCELLPRAWCDRHVFLKRRPSVYLSQHGEQTPSLTTFNMETTEYHSVLHWIMNIKTTTDLKSHFFLWSK